MDWNQAKGSWNEVKGQVKQHWGQLTDDDLMQISGDKDQLVGALQRRYGYTKDRAKQELDSFSNGMQARMSDATQSVQRVAENFGSAVERSTKEQPYTALAMAVAVGFALGALWRM